MKIINGKEIRKSFFRQGEFEEIEAVKKIIADVRINGDEAVRKYTEQFDNIRPDSFEISMQQVREAYKKLDNETISALREAAGNIRFFAKKQLSQFKDFEINKRGIKIGQKVIPLEKVGCYVPGGRYPLPSSALMTVIPAKVAGVKEIIVCSPKIAPVTIVAADMAGADRIFSIGGIQAIAAMAYGTESIPRVDKIVGPGNKYVTAAKREVYGEVGIDFLAGPSEILIISDDSGDSKFIAADLLAQAEHDPSAKLTLVTTSKKTAGEVNEYLEIHLPSIETRQTAEAALKIGSIVLVENLGEAVDLANKMAPEHLELQVKNPEKLIGKLRNYGSLFIGKFSAEVFGDYCSGTNHTLPTSRTARYTGGLSVKDFIKILTYQEIGEKSAAKMVGIASKLAAIEGLDAHKKSAEMRMMKRED